MNLLTLLAFLGAGVQGPTVTHGLLPSCVDNYQLVFQNDIIDINSIDSDRFRIDHDSKRWVVKFLSVPTADDGQRLLDAGLRIEGYIPHYAFLVSGNAEEINPEDDNLWLCPYQGNWKISSELSFDYGSSDTVHVWLFDDVDVDYTVQYIKEKFGATIHSSHDGGNKILMMSIDPGFLPDLAEMEEIRWIEAWHHPFFHNDQAQWVLQSWNEDNRSLWQRGLTGKGVVVSTGDAGITTGHVMFADSNVSITGWGDYPEHRKIIAYQPSSPQAVFGDMSSVSYHGTHTGATVCGNDSYWSQTSAYDGIAPDAKLYFIDDGGASKIAYPEDYNDMYDLPWTGNQAGQAKLMSNSWGSGTTGGAYDIPCRQTDEFVWNHPGFLILYSAGNDGHMGQGAVSAPSTAKNVVSVGASFNGTSANLPASFSSEGPTTDSRIKPAVVAPGYLHSADGNGTTGYIHLQGTSMSCPAIAGVTALIIQYLREGWYPSGSPEITDSIEPSAALLKAMLINSTIADFPNNTIPDTKIGWGRVCADSVLYFSGEDHNLYLSDYDQGLEAGEQATYVVDVMGDDWPLRITLVWSDPPGEPAAGIQLVNNLDLVAISPSGTCYQGNNFENNYSEPDSQKDMVNVEECLKIKKPQQGKWIVHVQAQNVPQGPQPFALVMNGMFQTARIELSPFGIRIDDTQSDPPDNALDPGESARLYPRISNTGEQPARSITVKLITDSPLLNIETCDFVSYPDIEPGEVKEGEGFGISLDSAALIDDVIDVQTVVKTNDQQYIDTLDYQIIVGVSGVEAGEERKVQKISVNCPQVVSGDFRINYFLPVRQGVTIELFDPVGRKVKTYARKKAMEPGWHSLNVSGCNAGVYFVTINAGNYSRNFKIVNVRN